MGKWPRKPGPFCGRVVTWGPKGDITLMHSCGFKPGDKNARVGDRIHHLDGNPRNNELSNLVIRKDSDREPWVDETRDELERTLALLDEYRNRHDVYDRAQFVQLVGITAAVLRPLIAERDEMLAALDGLKERAERCYCQERA
jgi:hypothetical protein